MTPERTMPAAVKTETDARGLGSAGVAENIIHALRGIRYGSVEIVVHDGRIVQIERKEKLRFDHGTSAPREIGQSSTKL